MSTRLWRAAFVVACALALPACPPPIEDKVIVELAVTGEQVGILYDGANAQGPFNDRGAIQTVTGGTSTTVNLGMIKAPAQGNTLIVFSTSRQPERVAAPWTTNGDTIRVPLRDELRFNVTFWILTGSFPMAQANAAAAVLAVNNAWREQRSGVRIGGVTTNDATADPDAAALLAGGSDAAYRNGIGFSPGEINVYVTDTVNGGANGSNFDGTPVILLGQGALTFPQLLEHEIGHAFVLWHVGAPAFNWENVMAPTVSAHLLTEGQNFRMNFHPSSQLNVFNLRPTQPTIVCGEPGIPATAECPANDRRLWADGALPAN